MDLRNSIWYFPGDPPVFETLATIALLAGAVLVVLGGLIFVATYPKALRRFRRSSLRWISWSLAVLAIPLAFATFGIGRRHVGEWAELKALISHYSGLVAAEVERGGGTTQLPALEMRLLNPPPTFQFEGYPGPVQIRIMQTTPPYVGVDFGNGANAVFDPRTMVCIYAD